jgi:diacylglycerol kinase (ATP)
MQPINKVLFIINPIAGIHQKEAIIKSIKAAFISESYEVVISKYPGHANEIALEKSTLGFNEIVAVGGDGTVNEIASALVNTHCKLGIIPAGSGNGLARHLNIPMVVSEALGVIKNHKIQIIDAGEANGRYFFCNCGIGFDASVGKKFAHYNKRGMQNYIRAILNKYITYSPKSYIIKINHKRIQLDAFLVTFANSGQYGNNAYIAPHAVINDGMLDMCVLRPFPKSSTIELGLRLFFKNIDQSPYLEVMQVKKATLKRCGKKKITIHLDGTPIVIKKKLKIKVIPEALQVMIPVANRKRKHPVLLSNKKLSQLKIKM